MGRRLMTLVTEKWFPIKVRRYPNGKGYIEGTVKVNDVLTHRKIFLHVRKTQKLIDQTMSDTSGNYRFDDLDETLEYDLRVQDFKRQYRDDILTAVKPKIYS